MSRGRRVLAFGASLMLIVCLWFALRGEREPAAHAAGEKAATKLTPSEGPLVHRRASAAPLTATAQPQLEDRIEIESVEVDKSEVCRGEEVTVTIKARSLDGEDEQLGFGALGQGRLVGPRFTLRPEESIGVDWLKVFARGRRGTSRVASVPPVLVKDCVESVQLRVAQRRDPDRQDRATFTPELSVAEGAAPFEPVSFEWDFGDGTKAQTTELEIEHSYESRPQISTYSYFFVSVTARDAAGRTARGSRSMRFVNLGFIPWRDEKRVTVFAGFSPGNQGESESAWLYHGAPLGVTITAVRVSDLVVDEGGVERQLNTRELAASEALGVSALPAGKSLAMRDLTPLRPTKPGSVRLVELVGHGPGTVVVEGAFVLRGPAAPVATDEVEMAEGFEEPRGFPVSVEQEGS